MGFFRNVKKGLRSEGVWLDREQARVLILLIHRSNHTGLVPFTKEEAQLFSRLIEREQEFKA